MHCALQAGGAAGLEAHLAGEREAAKPEFLRQRPKYYYYNEWMKKRIAALVGGVRGAARGGQRGRQVGACRTAGLAALSKEPAFLALSGCPPAHLPGCACLACSTLSCLPLWWGSCLAWRPTSWT